MDLEKRLHALAKATDDALRQALAVRDEDVTPLLDAMRYSAEGGGKRIRPALVLLFFSLFAEEEKTAMPYALALECIHTYSLIHDDLPCMDNDDLRRGRPTCHKAFGEARAVLAGDALLTYAFELAAGNPYKDSSANTCAVLQLAQAAGALGMVGGQEMDLNSEASPKTFEQLLKMHRLKTGALIRCAAVLGLIAAGAFDQNEIRQAAECYSDRIGLAFQIIDDLLDYTESSDDTGKTSSDDANKKTTFLSFMSVDEAFDYAARLTVEAIRIIAPYDRDDQLSCFARYLLFREK